MKLRIQVSLFEPKENAPAEVAFQKRIRMTIPFRVPFSLIVGFLLGVFLHYILYRISLPTHSFIYVNF
jgi:hypothetical protein